ncbi:S-layer homology domain-containing protein [Lysinibacillus endophyticus]|uniref:S-layer homology domain-containing protein n=1 Tax=Ureibacillus endophyticus TaxID=1978490 RepID=UPI00209F8EE0|nr:S-layer homology domain-containing protein [Lysinibacillus endophyticus]MCP1143703.1 S-layer homology domain-containing protein [Lysinibacillus endophyticus]
MTQYKKFVATAATATLVASAIVPVASAAGFTDVENNGHAQAINALADQGIINGYPDGTFKPNKELTRSDVVKLLGKYLVSKGYSVPADAKTKQRFTDVPVNYKDQELVEYAALVKDAGVFQGSNNNLNAANKITRGQMALVVVRALDALNGTDLVSFVAEQDFEREVIDLDAASKEQQGAIDVLDFFDITKTPNYNPKSSTTRGQFASFLYRAINVELEVPEVELTVKNVQVVDATTLNVTLSDDTAHVVKLNKALEANKATEVTFTIDEKEYSATVTYEVEELKVDSVKAINTTTVEVKFNKEVEKIDDITVTDTKTGEKIYVKEIKLAQDKKSATVTLFDALKSNSTYEVATKVAGKTFASSFNFVIGQPKTIELASQTVADNGKLTYKVLDENGLDITAFTAVDIESDKNNVFSYSNGAVTVDWKDDVTSAFLKLSVKKDGKVIAESSRVTVSTKAAPVATSLDSVWTVGEGNFAADDFKAEKSVALGSTNKAVKFQVLDQYGEPVNGATVQYTSLDASVAVIDKNSGAVTPRKEGKVAVKAELVVDGKVVDTKIVELTVTAAAKLTTIELAKTEANLTLGGNNAEVTYKTLDQFGNEFAVSEDTEVKVTTADEKVAKANVADGTVTITAVGEGSTSITLTVGTLEKTIAVKVAKVGTIVDYTVEGFVEDLKTKDDGKTATVTENQMTVAIYGKDANGTLATTPTSATFTVTDKDGKVITAASSNGSVASQTISSSALEAGQTYTLTAKVGTLTVATKTFTVTENGVAPTVKLVKDKLTVKGGTTVKAELDKLIQFTANENVDVAITGLDYISNNTSVVASSTADNLNFSTTVDGTADVFVSAIKVNVTAKDGATNVDPKLLGNFTIENDWKFAFTTDNTAPKFAVPTEIKLEENILKFNVSFDDVLYFNNKNADSIDKLVAGKGVAFAYINAFKVGTENIKVNADQINTSNQFAKLLEDGKTFEVQIDATDLDLTNGVNIQFALPEGAAELTDVLGNAVKNSAVYVIKKGNDNKITITESK